MVKSNTIEIIFKSYNNSVIQVIFRNVACARESAYMEILHGFLVLSDLMLCSFMIHIFFSGTT